MMNYVIRRLLLMIPTLIGITMLVFAIMAMAPGGLGATLRSAEGDMRPEQRRQVEDYLKKRYGLDQSLYRQYLRWLNQVSPIGVKDIGGGFPTSLKFGLKVPDLGESFLARRPVIEVIADTLPVTLLLNVVTLPIIYAIAVTTGIVSAKKRGQLYDMGIGTTLLALWSIPTMWSGVMLLGYFANKDYLNWFPSAGLHDTRAEQMAFLPGWGAGGFERGWLLDVAWHLALPVVCLTYGGFAFLSKLMRSSMLENLSADFTRTARAKGLSEHVVVYRHVLRNSLLPMITVAAGILPGLFGGSLIIESIFSINGMGKLMLDAIHMKDRELVMSETYVIGVISLICLIIADLGYALADPRVSYE